jgi:hypothetical protein
MEKLSANILSISFNASGAAQAAKSGNLVMIIDVIDMSTSAEVALEAGAIEVFGASPDGGKTPVEVNPEKIAYFAGKEALKHNTGVIIANEPRIRVKQERIDRLSGIKQAIKGIEKSGAKLIDIIPNMGREIAELIDFKDRIFLVVSSSGGVAFDVAFNYGAPGVITGTIARTNKMKSKESARLAAKRAIEKANSLRCGICLIASSSNSMEDILAAEYISKEIINYGFLDRK